LAVVAGGMRGVEIERPVRGPDLDAQEHTGEEAIGAARERDYFRAHDGKAAQDRGPLVEPDRRSDRPVEPFDAEDLRGRRRVDPPDAGRPAQALGDVAAGTAERGLLQGHDIGTERGELLDDQLEPLVQVGAAADEPGPRPSVQEVEGDHAYRVRLAL